MTYARRREGFRHWGGKTLSIRPARRRPLCHPRRWLGFWARLPCVRRLIDMFTNERDHINGTRDTGKTRIEDQLRDTCSCLDLCLQNVRLQRVDQPLVQQIRRHLIGNCTCRFDKHLIRDARGLRREDCHPNGWKDIKVVGLPREKYLSM